MTGKLVRVDEVKYIPTSKGCRRLEPEVEVQPPALTLNMPPWQQWSDCMEAHSSAKNKKKKKLKVQI